MWRSSGWPAKVMPNISHVSRSCQLAPAYTLDQDSMVMVSSGTSTFSVSPTWRWGDTTRAQHLEPGLAAGAALLDLGGALGRRLGRVVLALAVRRRHPVEGREEAEVLAPEPVADGQAGGPPGVGAHPHPQVVAGPQVVVDDGVAQLGA